MSNEMTPELRDALRRCQLASEGDSNDEEIEALGEALGLVMERAGIEWPKFPEPYTTYHDDSDPEEPLIMVVGIDADDGTVELDNDQWYDLNGPEGFLAKLDAGIIRAKP